MRRPLTLNVFFLLLYQFKKNKVRDYTDSDSDYDEYDQEDRDLILRQVPDSLTVSLPQGFFQLFLLKNGVKLKSVFLILPSEFSSRSLEVHKDRS